MLMHWRANGEETLTDRQHRGRYDGIAIFKTHAASRLAPWADAGGLIGALQTASRLSGPGATAEPYALRHAAMGV